MYLKVFLRRCVLRSNTHFWNEESTRCMHMVSENDHQETDSDIVSGENAVMRSKAEAGGIIACPDHWESSGICKQ